MSRKIEVVGNNEHRKAIIREVKEIDMSNVENVKKLINELDVELIKIKSQVKSLKARAEEIQEIKRFLKKQ